MRFRKTLVLLPLLAGAALLVPACSDDGDPAGIPAGVEIFLVTLTGTAERPTPVTTTATGTATITVMGNLVSWKVDVVGLDSLILGHIHKGVADSAGGVMVDLAPAPRGLDFTGTATQGSAVVADSVLTHMRNQRAYVNLHTRVNGGGELRGTTIKQ